MPYNGPAPPRAALPTNEWARCPKCSAKWDLIRYAGYGCYPPPNPPNPVKFKVKGLSGQVIEESCWRCGYTFERPCDDAK